MSNTFHSTPRPLPYDADPGFFRSRLVSRRDKGSSHSREEAEPLRSHDAADVDSESFSVEGSKWASSKLMVSGEDSKDDFSKSTRRIVKSKSMDAGGNDGVYVMSDDEDVCPTCLEGIHFHFESMHLKEALVSHIFFARFLKNTHQRTRRLLQSVVTITTSAAFMNGWREAKTVLFVER